MCPTGFIFGDIAGQLPPFRRMIPFLLSQSRLELAVWAGAPSCWKYTCRVEALWRDGGGHGVFTWVCQMTHRFLMK